MTDADLREAVARALALEYGAPPNFWPHYTGYADAAIALVVARCAEVARQHYAESRTQEPPKLARYYGMACGDIEEALLALAPQEPSHER